MTRTRLGWILAAAALMALLLSVRIPARREPDVYRANSVPAAVEDIPVKRGAIPVNLADASALDALPEIGPVIAQAIVDERESDGPFYYPEDLDDVKGIGEWRVQVVYDLVDLWLPDEK